MSPLDKVADYLNYMGCNKTASAVRRDSGYVEICEAMIDDGGFECDTCLYSFESCAKCEGMYEFYFDVEECKQYLARVRPWLVGDIDELRANITQLCYNHVARMDGWTQCNIEDFELNSTHQWELICQGSNDIVTAYNSGKNFVEIVKLCGDYRYATPVDSELPPYCFPEFCRVFLHYFEEYDTDDLPTAVRSIEEIVYELFI